MTPFEGFKKNEKVVLSDLQDKRQKHKSKNNRGNFVRTADLTKVFSEGDSTN